jgi:hypothetical protein
MPAQIAAMSDAQYDAMASKLDPSKRVLLDGLRQRGRARQATGSSS